MAGLLRFISAFSSWARSPAALTEADHSTFELRAAQEAGLHWRPHWIVGTAGGRWCLRCGATTTARVPELAGTPCRGIAAIPWRLRLALRSRRHDSHLIGAPAAWQHRAAALGWPGL